VGSYTRIHCTYVTGDILCIFVTLKIAIYCCYSCSWRL